MLGHLAAVILRTASGFKDAVDVQRKLARLWCGAPFPCRRQVMPLPIS